MDRSEESVEEKDVFRENIAIESQNMDNGKWMKRMIHKIIDIYN